MWKHRFNSMCQPFRDTWMELPRKESFINEPSNPLQKRFSTYG